MTNPVGKRNWKDHQDIFVRVWIMALCSCIAFQVVVLGIIADAFLLTFKDSFDTSTIEGECGWILAEVSCICGPSMESLEQ